MSDNESSLAAALKRASHEINNVTKAPPVQSRTEARINNPNHSLAKQLGDALIASAENNLAAAKNDLELAKASAANIMAEVERIGTILERRKTRLENYSSRLLEASSAFNGEDEASDVYTVARLANRTEPGNNGAPAS